MDGRKIIASDGVTGVSETVLCWHATGSQEDGGFDSPNLCEAGVCVRSVIALSFWLQRWTTYPSALDVGIQSIRVWGVPSSFSSQPPNNTEYILALFLSAPGRIGCDPSGLGATRKVSATCRTSTNTNVHVVADT